MQTGKAGLLLWCQKTTAAYPNVKVENFHTSWRNGLAFCAIIHYFEPSAIDYKSLAPENMLRNNQIAFETAARLGIPALLDAEDMLMEKPDQFSVITYLSGYYNKFVKGDAQGRGGAIDSIKVGPSNGPAPTPPSKRPIGTSSAGPSNRGTISVPKCKQCEKPLVGQTVEWSGALFHQNCFKCTGCSAKFTKGCANINNMPFCDTCCAKINASKSPQGPRPSEALRAAPVVTPSTTAQTASNVSSSRTTTMSSTTSTTTSSVSSTQSAGKVRGLVGAQNGATPSNAQSTNSQSTTPPTQQSQPNEKPIYCRECGTSQPRSKKFCENCGTAMGNASPRAATPTTNNATSLPPTGSSTPQRTSHSPRGMSSSAGGTATTQTGATLSQSAGPRASSHSPPRDASSNGGASSGASQQQQQPQRSSSISPRGLANSAGPSPSSATTQQRSGSSPRRNNATSTASTATTTTSLSTSKPAPVRPLSNNSALPIPKSTSPSTASIQSGTPTKSQPQVPPSSNSTATGKPISTASTASSNATTTISLPQTTSGAGVCTSCGLQTSKKFCQNCGANLTHVNAAVISSPNGPARGNEAVRVPLSNSSSSKTTTATTPVPPIKNANAPLSKAPLVEEEIAVTLTRSKLSPRNNGGASRPLSNSGSTKPQPNAPSQKQQQPDSDDASAMKRCPRCKREHEISAKVTRKFCSCGYEIAKMPSANGLPAPTQPSTPSSPAPTTTAPQSVSVATTTTSVTTTSTVKPDTLSSSAGSNKQQAMSKSTPVLTSSKGSTPSTPSNTNQLPLSNSKPAKETPSTPTPQQQSVATTRSVKQCISCGTLSTEDEPFCEKCGRKVVEVPVAIPSSPQITVTTAPTEPPQLSPHSTAMNNTDPASNGAPTSKPLPSLANRPASGKATGSNVVLPAVTVTKDKPDTKTSTMPNLPIKRAVLGKSATTGISSPSNADAKQASCEEFNFGDQPLNSPTRVKSSLSNPPPVSSSPRGNSADGNDSNATAPVNPLATSPRRKPQLVHQRAKTELGYSPSGKPRPVTSPRPRDSNAASPRATPDKDGSNTNDATSPRGGDSQPEAVGQGDATVWDDKLDELISDFGGTATNSKFERAMRKTIIQYVDENLADMGEESQLDSIIAGLQALDDIEQENFETVDISKLNVFSMDNYFCNPEMCGFLKKRTKQKFGSGYKEFWYSLQECRLLEFSREVEAGTFGKSSHPTSIVSLKEASSVQLTDTQYGFSITLDDHVLEFKAPDLSAQKKWVNGLEYAIKIYRKIEKHVEADYMFGISKADFNKEGEAEIKFGHHWKKYYLAMKDGMLFVRKRQHGAVKKKIPLIGCRFEDLEVKNEERFAFKVILDPSYKDKELLFSFFDEMEMQHWLNALLKQKLIIEEAINTIIF